MTQLYNFLTGNGGVKDMDDCQEKVSTMHLYDDRKGFFVKLEKANEK